MASSARREIAAAHLREPPLDLTPKSDAAAWARRSGADAAADRQLAAAARWPDRIAAGLCRGRLVGAGRGGRAAGPPARRRRGQASHRSLRRARRQDRAAGRRRRRRHRRRPLGPAAGAAARQPDAARPRRRHPSSPTPHCGSRPAARTPSCWTRPVRRPARSAAIPTCPGSSGPSDVAELAALQARLLQARRSRWSSPAACSSSAPARCSPRRAGADRRTPAPATRRSSACRFSRRKSGACEFADRRRRRSAHAALPSERAGRHRRILRRPPAATLKARPALAGDLRTC